MSRLSEYISILGKLFYSQPPELTQFWHDLPEESRQAFLAGIQREKFTSFLLYRLNSGLSQELQDKYRATQMGLLQRAMRNEYALKPLFADFDKAGLRFACLKGIDLAYRIYPSPSLRPFGDWDILFHIEDLEKAQALLRSKGWQDVVHKVHGPGEHHDSPLVKDGYFLEPHYTLSCFGQSHTHDIWEHCLPYPGYQNRFVLSPELNLLLIARHASEDKYRTIGITKLLLDTAFLLQKENLDWQRLKLLCQEMHLPYAGNLFAAFPEFFPQDLVAAMDASPEQANAYRQIFEKRDEFMKITTAEFMMNNEARFTSRWFLQIFNVFHPKNLRYKYHIRDNGKLKLLGAYFRETGSKIGKLTHYIFCRNKKVPSFLEYIQIAEGTAKRK